VGGYAVVLVVAAVGTWLLTFVVRRAAVRFNMIVMPDATRVHTKPLATGGGAAMFLGFLLSMAVASQIPQFRPVFSGNSEPIGVILGAAIIFAVGLADDAREMSPPAKLSGQVLAGSVLALLGVAMLFFRIPFGGYISLSTDWQPLVLGLLMASSTLLVVGQTDADFSGKTFFFFAPVFIPFFILGIPILDTAFAIIRRAGKRGSPAVRDIDHLHHRLMRLGHGHRRTVVILWAWTAVLSGLVLYPTFTNRGSVVVPLLVAALGIGLYTGFHPGVRRRNGGTGGD
jgi:UDP-N-acetylmuramyl pentapeptide phosphotransferase/UDP-N-acetylglucosamine-1-phosphate transferase